jgi:hypothetical protein
MRFLDSLPLGWVLVLCILLMVAFIEIGFRMAGLPQIKAHKTQMAQVRAIMGASLGLLAFMLAFSFSMAQTHFEARTQAYMLEISAIDSAYRGADLLNEQAQYAAKDLLKQFASLRLDTARAVRENDSQQMVAMIQESERMHDTLWSLAEGAMAGSGEGESSGIFAQSVLAMIDAHDARLQAAFFNRISPVIWMTLFLMALMSMIVMGYQAGLTGTRSQIATWTLAITFSAVMTLVTDLDRPRIEMVNRMEGNERWESAAGER